MKWADRRLSRLLPVCPDMSSECRNEADERIKFRYDKRQSGGGSKWRQAARR